MARTKGRGRKNSGHWTEIESQLLHVGLERYGRDWHAISRFVGTRYVHYYYYYYYLADRPVPVFWFPGRGKMRDRYR